MTNLSLNEETLIVAILILLAVIMETTHCRFAGFQLLWLETRWKLAEWKDRLAPLCASLLPRWLVMAASIRLVAHATTGRYGDTLVPELTAMTALKRWEKSND